MTAPAASESTAEPALDLAASSIAALQRAGVAEVVVCAGARNAALVAIIAATPSLRHWSFPEERCAAFFALGRALALGAPVAVVTTSGTAAAELLPAVIEAHYQGVPLVLVTADRPRRFRGTGAPQAIEQPGLFTGYVAACGDVASPAELAAFAETWLPWDRRRPVHLNMCLEEPDAAALARAEAATGTPSPPVAPPRARSTALDAFLADTAAGPLVVVAGALPAAEQPAIAAFLARLGAPVVAEATSGLREEPRLTAWLVHGGEAALAALPCGRVLRLGGVPSSRWWRDLEKRSDVRVLSLTHTGFPGLARASLVAEFPDWTAVAVPPNAPAPPSPTAPPAGRPDLEPALADHPRSEPSLVRVLSGHIPAGSLVFLGNSLPIREWNAFATTDPRALRCHANRGANGIDGCVSTFLGLAADEPESWAVVGDLTALYDLAALWITPALPPGRRRIAVINNGGGRIFSRVAALRGLAEEPRRLMENPHALRFDAWAALFGWSYTRAATPEAVAAAARLPDPSLVIEITPDPAETETVWSRLTPGSRPDRDADPRRPA